MTLKELEEKGENATLHDFISFYEAIPESKWCTRVFHQGDQCCARGHLGTKWGGDVVLLDTHLLSLAPLVAEVNNGYDHLISGRNPKERVINYLKRLVGEGN